MAELIVQLAAAAGLRLSSTASSVGAVLELWTVVEGRLWARQQPTRQLRALLQTDEVLLAVEQPPQAPQGQEQEQAQQQHEFVQLVHRVPRRQPMQLVGIPALLRVPLAAAVPEPQPLDSTAAEDSDTRTRFMRESMLWRISHSSRTTSQPIPMNNHIQSRVSL